MITVSFNGQISQVQAEENVQGSHIVTAAMENVLTEVLLGLFVLWDQLPAPFQQHAANYKAKRDACVKVWNIVEPTLSLHNQSN